MVGRGEYFYERLEKEDEKRETGRARDVYLEYRRNTASARRTPLIRRSTCLSLGGEGMHSGGAFIRA